MSKKISGTFMVHPDLRAGREALVAGFADVLCKIETLAAQQGVSPVWDTLHLETNEDDIRTFAEESHIVRYHTASILAVEPEDLS